MDPLSPPGGTAPRPGRGRNALWISLLALLLVGIVGVVVIPGLLSPTCRITYEHALRSQVGALHQAQRRYWGEVPRKAFNESLYWHKDIASLHTFKTAYQNEPCLDLAMALADERPVADLSSLGVRAPYYGYWFRSIRPSKENDPGGDHYAICAFPAEYRSGSRLTFVLDDEHGTYMKDLGQAQKGVEVFPADLEKEGWAPTGR